MAILKPVLGRGLVRSLKMALTGQKIPLIAGHKLQYSCNLRCKMCPFWRREDEELLSLKEEIRMMDSLKKAGVLFLGFEGGEPLLRKDIAEILRESYRRFHTSMVTNGWLLKSKLDSIKDYLNHTFVSLDGIGEVHDRLRGVSGSFKRAVEGIEAASEEIPLSISYTITRENMDQAKDMVSLADDLEVTVNFQIAYDYGTAEKESPEREQLRSTLLTLSEMKAKGKPILNSREYFASVLDSWYGGDSWTCKPWMTINVDPLGNVVLPCYVLNEYSGTQKIWDVNVGEIWRNYKWEVYESCNKCALACYLEPSLFSWSNFSMIKSRIIDNIVPFIQGNLS